MIKIAEYQALIEQYFEGRHKLSPDDCPQHLKKCVSDIFNLLSSGQIRVAQKTNQTWEVNEWIKKAILLSFKINPNEVISAHYTNFFDKISLKHPDYNAQDFERDKVRVVPGAIVRDGCFIAPNTVLMPCFVNSGAYIDSGCMIDTWATVGSCAQIGKNVHLSGGVGIGGVLEPLQASPTIIEDNCFVGARSEIVEGVVVEENAVISMGVFIGQSTKIYNRLTGEITYGRVPKNAVVVPGSLPSADNSYNLNCAVIVKFVDEKTRNKVQLNELLRD
jgi:2,3,4,5-tetrahydropyridine-2-carboxylate N-succinyltransferase